LDQRDPGDETPQQPVRRCCHKTVLTRCKGCPYLKPGGITYDPVGGLESQHPNERPVLSTNAQERKESPIARGLLDYFPKASAYVAFVSMLCNEQHNPGEPMHWAREKSTDEADALVRHVIDRGKLDKDGVRHSGKVAWRALAMLERELDGEKV
jgi:hypothetical protein